MRMYRPKKWLTCIRVVLIVFCLFFLNGASLYSITSKSIKNENLEKAVELNIIEEDQKDLYAINNPEPKPSDYEAINTFIGELTGYVGNCPLCSGVVACKRINVLKEGILYEDEDFGTVRMVASSKKYPCGTILRFNVNRLQEEPIIAIVLDRGVGGDVIDLLTESEDVAIKKIGRMRNMEFDILRHGWDK